MQFIDPNLETFEFAFGKVVNDKMTAIAVQYESDGVSNLLIDSNYARMLVPDTAPPSMVVTQNLVFLKNLASIVRGNALFRTRDLLLMNDMLMAEGLKKFTKDARDYPAINAPDDFNEALRTMIVAGLLYPTLIFVPVDAMSTAGECARLSPTLWDNGGIAVHRGVYGFKSHNAAVAALLHLPSECVLVRR